MLELPRFHLLEPHKLEELLLSRKADYANRVIESAEDLFREFLCANGLSTHIFLTEMIISITHYRKLI